MSSQDYAKSFNMPPLIDEDAASNKISTSTIDVDGLNIY
jgi:hypothetical protein